MTAVSHKAPSLVAAMILARAFSTESMGQYFVATAACFLIVLFTAFGTHQHLVRGVASAPEQGLELLGRALVLRLPLTALALLALNGGTLVFAPDLLAIMAPVSLFVLIGDFSNSFGAYVTGRRRFRLRAAISLAGPVVLISSVPVAILAGAALSETLLCFVVSAVVAATVAGATVSLKFGVPPMADVRPADLRRLMLLCWPFVGLEALQIIQFKADVLMVFWIASSEAAAQYETAYRLLEVSRIAARPLVASALPICAHLVAQEDWTGARRRASLTLFYAALIGLAPMLAGLAAPEWIMTLVWGGAYAEAAPVLRILLAGAPLVFVVLIGVMLAVVMGRERSLMALMAAAAVFNILANTAVIPVWGGVGAAWTTLATEGLIVFGLVLTLKRTKFVGVLRQTAQDEATKNQP